MRVLKRGNRATISAEPFSGVDGQGAATYGTAVEIEVRWMKMDELVRDAVGTEIRTTLAVWVDGAEPMVPGRGDRLTVGGATYIVMEQKAPEGVRSAVVDHVRLKCREE